MFIADQQNASFEHVREARGASGAPGHPQFQRPLRMVRGTASEIIRVWGER